MSHGAIGAAFAATSLVALWLLIVALRSARDAGDLNSSTALILGMGALFSLPNALVAVSGALRRVPDTFGDLVVVNPSWYQPANNLFLLVLASLAVVLMLRHANSGAMRVNVAGLFALLLWTVASLASGLQGQALLSSRAGVLVICLLAATVLPRGRGACLGGGIFGVTLAAAGGVLALFRYKVAFVVPCRGACSGLGFSGVLPNENLLGIALVASIPLAYLGFRGRPRFWLSLFIAGGAIATGSRSAGLGAVLMLVALTIVRPRLDATDAPFGRTATAWFFLAGAITSSVFIVRHHWDPSALTTRPTIWGVAWHYIDRAPWFGHGPYEWATLYQSSQITLAAQRSTFNQWTDVLFISGGVGLALFVGMLATAVLSAGRARAGVLLMLAAIFMIGTTEGVWSIGTIDLLSFSLAALILTGPERVTHAPAAAPARREAWLGLGQQQAAEPGVP